MNSTLLRAGVALVMFFASGAWAQDALPAAAQQIIAQYDKQAAAVRAKADAELKKYQDDAVAKLKVLQDASCRAARLDEALRLREEARRIIGLRPDPGILHLTSEDIGSTMLFEVVGAVEGSLWGSEVFTGDSNLASAAVHSGVLRPGQRGAVRVRVIAGQTSYAGSTSNGVSSQPYDAWNVSFTVEPGPPLPK